MTTPAAPPPPSPSEERDWGVTTRAATSGRAVYGIANVLVYLALP